MIITKGFIDVKKNLDNRMCDVEKHIRNAETYREFILDKEQNFNLTHKDVDSMTTLEVAQYFADLVNI